MNKLINPNMIVLDIHSTVDLITNSSTVIFTYQSSVKQAKNLVQEILNLMGETSLTPDDVFYYGEFHSPDFYDDRLNDLDEEDLPEGISYEDSDFDVMIQEALKTGVVPKILELQKHEEWSADTYLYLLPKNEKYEGLAQRIKELLNSIDTAESYN